MQPVQVRVFKNELRNYTYYLHEVTTLENSIEFLYHRLGGVRGIDPSKMPMHSMPDKDLEYKLRDEISKLERKLSLVSEKKNYIDSILMRIETPIKDAIIDVYVKGKQTRNVAMKYYLSHSALIKRMNKAIGEALK